MKTNKEASLATTTPRFSPPTFLTLNMRSGIFAALILTLTALQPRLFIPSALAESPAGKNSQGSQHWSVQVDQVNPGDVSLDPSFGAAIYENLLQELGKTKQFKRVFRGGDRNANDVPGLLILKTTVQKYTAGSETRRAVTTVSGATKLNVHIQLSTREGHIVVEQFVEGDVRFLGNNLRATHNLAHNVAVALNRSTLPESAILAPEGESGKMSKD